MLIWYVSGWYGGLLCSVCPVSKNISHESMALFVLRKLFLQSRMRSHPVGIDVSVLVGPFVYFHTSYVRTAKLWRDCVIAWIRRLVWAFAGHLCNKYCTIISWAGSNIFRTFYWSLYIPICLIFYLYVLFNGMSSIEMRHFLSVLSFELCACKTIQNKLVFQQIKLGKKISNDQELKHPDPTSCPRSHILPSKPKGK